jgi:hypothetical protein
MPPPGAKQRRAINAELKRVCEADFGVYPGKTGNWLRVVFVATNPKQGCGLTGLRAGQLTDDVGKWTITGWMFAWDRSSNRKWEAKACTLDIPVDYVRGVYNFTVPTAYSCSVEPAKPAAGVITLIDEARKGEKRL